MGNWVTSLGLPEVFEGLLCCTTSTLRALCSSCTTGYPRFIFSLFLLFGTISSFLVLSPNMRSNLDKLPYFCTTVTTEKMCDNLVGYGAVYRICFSLSVFYGAFALFMLNSSSKKDIRVKLHNGYWFLKLVFLVAILVGSFHIPRFTEFGRLWMYVGLTAGFIFIMIQILLVIDFAHSWSFSWAERIESGNGNFWSIALAFSTVLVYSMAITMAVFYYLYFTDIRDLSKCRGNMFLISFNVFHCLLASVISILPRVQETAPGSGLLQSSIVSLYTMYLTWCTLSSEPDGSCNPMGDLILEYDKVSGVNGQAIFDCVLMFALLIFACNVRSSTSKLQKIGFSLSKYSTAAKMEYGEKSYRERDDAEKYVGEENIDGEEYLEHNYSLFHFVMVLASLQLMMVVTNWHSPDELADLKKLVKNWATVWIQLTSSFLCVLFYIWAIVTPLLVSIWGPCLGLDYESVPTEDDYDRIRRRREMIREREGKMQGNCNSGRIETSFVNITNEGSSSKNHGVKQDFNHSIQTLGNLSLSSVKRAEEITGDSGMCETNFTSHSRTVSRASVCPHSSKSMTFETRLSSPEHTSESALGRSYNKVRPSDKEWLGLESKRNSNSRERLSDPIALNNTSNEIERENHAQRKFGSDHLDQKTSTDGTRNDKKSLTLPRPQSAQLYLNNEIILEKQQKTHTRPHSSMAFTNRILSRGSPHDFSIVRKSLTRPKTCEPSITLQSNETLRKETEENCMTGPFEGENSRKISSYRNERYVMNPTPYQEAGDIQIRSQESHKELSKTVEQTRPASQLSCVNEPITQTDSLEESLKPIESPVLQNATEQELNKNTEETNGGQETFNNKAITERNDEVQSEKVFRTPCPLKMQDHLKWIQRLRRTKEKVMPLNVRDISKTKPSVGGRTSTQTSKIDNRNTVKALSNTSAGNTKGNNKTGEHGLEAHSSKSPITHVKDKAKDTDTKDSCKQVDQVNTPELLNNSQSRPIKSCEDIDTLDQSLGMKRKINSTEENTISNKQSTRCQSELQTRDVSMEILRLQEKILKFQAKVVKTQQRIFEMQQDCN